MPADELPAHLPRQRGVARRVGHGAAGGDDRRVHVQSARPAWSPATCRATPWCSGCRPASRGGCAGAVSGSTTPATRWPARAAGATGSTAGCSSRSVPSSPTEPGPARSVTRHERTRRSDRRRCRHRRPGDRPCLPPARSGAVGRRGRQGAGIAAHQSSHNSGVIHAGVYCRPGRRRPGCAPPVAGRWSSSARRTTSPTPSAARWWWPPTIASWRRWPPSSSGRWRTAWRCGASPGRAARARAPCGRGGRPPGAGDGHRRLRTIRDERRRST